MLLILLFCISHYTPKLFSTENSENIYVHIKIICIRPFERGRGNSERPTACACAKYSDYFTYNMSYTSITEHVRGRSKQIYTPTLFASKRCRIYMPQDSC